MTLALYNTLSRKKEEFQPRNEKAVTLYTCGPTVYNYAHIGNMRTYIFEDLLRRYLEYKGYHVRQVMNITDVDDKTIKGSQDAHTSLAAFTLPFKQAFFDDCKTLNILPAHRYPEATAHVTEMIELIDVLLEKGYAYQGDDKSIYFAIKKFPTYGKLNHLSIDTLKKGARVNHDEYEKEDAADFALWKSWDEKDGPVAWDSPFGKGRPGWHIECSAMSMKHLSNAFSEGNFDPALFETIDIHTGGVDNAFPHHEDELAQSECATGKPFVKYWLHAEHLLVNNKKMSKSLGNFYTLRDLLAKGHKPAGIRYALLSTHYRQQMNFTLTELSASENAVERMQELIRKLQTASGSESDITAFLTEAEDTFQKALDDDLNIHAALSGIFTLIKNINGLLEQGLINKEAATDMLTFFQKINTVLDILDFDTDTISPELQTLIDKREEARKKKDFKTSDTIRKELEAHGILLDDTPQGVRWKRK